VNRTSAATRNILFGVINRFVSMIFPFLIRTVIINTISVQYLGISSLFTSILQILDVTELGFSSAITYCLYEPVAHGKTCEVQALMNLYRKIYNIVGSIIFAVGLCILPFLPKLIHGEIPADTNLYLLYIMYLMNTVLSYWLFAYKGALLYVHQRNDISVNIQSITLTLQYLIQIGVLYVFRSYYLYFAITILSTVIRNILNSIVVDIKYSKYKSQGEVDRKVVSEIKKKVSGLFVQKICRMTRNSFDSIALSVSVGLTVVAQYGNYYYIMYAVISIVGIIAGSIRASVANELVTENMEKNKNDFFLFQFMFAWISGFCVSCLLCLYQKFMYIWIGEDLMLGMREVILFCIYFYLMMMVYIRSVYDDASGIWWESKEISIFESVTNIVLNFILGKHFGICGIIFATIVSILIWDFSIKSRYLFKIKFFDYKVTEFYKAQLSWALIAAIISICSYYCSNLIFPGNGFIPFFGTILICMVVSNILYFVIFRKSKYWGNSMQLLQRSLNSMIRR